MVGVRRLIIGAILFAVALSLGFGWRDIASGELPKLGDLPSALSGGSKAGRGLIPTRAFSEALDNIESYFYGEADLQGVTHAAVQGMMASLGDPHTSLLRPEQAQLFEERTRGRFIRSGGVGAELTPNPINGRLGARVSRVFKDGPAARRGLQPNDVILKVNGRDVQALHLEDIVQRIRGDEGTPVSLTIFRARTDETLTYNLVRELAEIQDVYSELIEVYGADRPPLIGRLEVRSFSETIISQFDDELRGLEEKGIQGLIIDMRGNRGGILGSAVEMSARFLDNKLITTMKGRGGRDNPYSTQSGHASGRGYPIVILVDERTASAAEIFAGALQDYSRATIVGERTYGKALVQNVQKLSDGAQANITIGRYYLPRGGRSIQRVEDEDGNYLSGGIKPDVVVERSFGDDLASSDLESDNQLRKAVDVILGKLS